MMYSFDEIEDMAKAVKPSEWHRTYARGGGGGYDKFSVAINDEGEPLILSITRTVKNRKTVYSVRLYGESAKNPVERYDGDEVEGLEDLFDGVSKKYKSARLRHLRKKGVLV